MRILVPGDVVRLTTWRFVSVPNKMSGVMVLPQGTVLTVLGWQAPCFFAFYGKGDLICRVAFDSRDSDCVIL